MLLDSTLLSSDAIGDVEGVDNLACGGNAGVAVFKDAPDNDNDADDDEDKDDQKDDDDDWESNDAAATDIFMVIGEMLSDSRLVSSDAIGDVEGVDTVGDGGNGGVAVIKDDPDNDNDADDEKDDQEDDDDD